MMSLPKRMYAGVVDGQIYIVPVSGDDYVPFGVALFKSKAEAKKLFETVIEINPAELLGVKAKVKA